MLYIGRKKDEVVTFILEDETEIIVKIISSNEQFGTELGITAPKNVKVWRGKYNGENESDS